VSQCDPLKKEYRSFLDELENKKEKKSTSKDQYVEAGDGIHESAISLRFLGIIFRFSDLRFPPSFLPVHKAYS
jgi:hypothetical protein